MATENETIWDQHWDQFSMPTKNQSFLFEWVPKWPIASLYGSIVTVNDANVSYIEIGKYRILLK